MIRWEGIRAVLDDADFPCSRNTKDDDDSNNDDQDPCATEKAILADFEPFFSAFSRFLLRKVDQKIYSGKLVAYTNLLDPIAGLLANETEKDPNFETVLRDALENGQFITSLLF